MVKAAAADKTSQYPHSGQPLVGKATVACKPFQTASQYPHSRAASCRATQRDEVLPMRLNTLTVGQPLVGNDYSRPVAAPPSQYPHSRAASCREVAIQRMKGEPMESQYPHSRAASCRAPKGGKIMKASKSQYPHSRAASCRAMPVGAAPKLPRLNTLTVGQPLVGAPRPGVQVVRYGLNTLTVGQPLVGTFHVVVPVGACSSLNTLTVGQPLVGRPPPRLPRPLSRSQYPHSRAASCRVRYCQRSLGVGLCLNTLTVGQPLVGECQSLNPSQWSQVSIPSQSGSLLSGLSMGNSANWRVVSIPSQSGSLLSGTIEVCTTCTSLCLNTLTVGQPLVG